MFDLCCEPLELEVYSYNVQTLKMMQNTVVVSFLLLQVMFSRVYILFNNMCNLNVSLQPLTVHIMATILGGMTGGPIQTTMMGW